MSMVRPPNPLGLVQLEDRTVPALFGNPWPDADRITVSFVPDGTDVGGVGSTLNQTLGHLPAATWQREVLRGFQVWAEQANLNFAVVADSGVALGTPGPAQGAAGYGDIRVSARPLSDDVLAISNPFDLHSAWAGEIVLNSNKPFAVGTVADHFDLFTVAVQEAGHALGLANSPDPASVMNTNYLVPRTRLTAGDIAAVRALYGARVADPFDRAGSNQTRSTATEIGFVGVGGGPLLVTADLTHGNDVDVYEFETPEGGSRNFQVAIRTDGLSLLNSRVQVLDDDGRAVNLRLPNGQLARSAAVQSANGQPFVVTVENAELDEEYYVVVSSPTSDALGTGKYQLAVGRNAASVFPSLTPAGWRNPDNNTNNARSQATFLGTVTAHKPDARWNLVTRAALESASDVDFYRVRTGSTVLPNAVVLVSGLSDGQLALTLEFYAANGARLPHRVISSDGGTLAVQLSGVLPNTDYFARVASSTGATGNYLLAADFRADPVELTPLAAVTLEGARNQAFASFRLARSQVVYLNVEGEAGVNAAVRMTVYDADRKAVFTRAARPGELVGGEVLLAPGEYTIRYVAATADGSPLPRFQFRSNFDLTTDPIGPQPVGPTDPTPEPYSPPPVYSYTPEEQSYVETINEVVVTTPPSSGGTGEVIFWQPAPPRYTFIYSFDDVYSDPWGWSW